MTGSIEKAFSVNSEDLKRIIRSFHIEMAAGLSGHSSSLKMIPTYADKPTGNERGRFISLDLGGTNFRILELELKGKGKYSVLGAKRFKLDKGHISGSGERLFDFIADSVKVFLNLEKVPLGQRRDLGFTFSFPVKQTSLASGDLLKWTKGFSSSGVEGADVVKLLNDALMRRGLSNVRVAALMNDTVGALIARSYEDRACDMGIIIGTGTNACYLEELANIPKWKYPAPPGGRMIINIEWGNFNKLRRNIYDKELDRASDNPGHQMLEKMVSGMYLGELARLVFRAKRFKTEDISEIEADTSRGLSRVRRIAKKLGLRGSTQKERRFIKDVCALISLRAARISAACLAAVITRMDQRLARTHTIAIDGSVYERHPNFSKNVDAAMREIFGKGSGRIKIVLTKDGSGKGAAILAAAAAGLKG